MTQPIPPAPQAWWEEGTGKLIWPQIWKHLTPQTEGFIKVDVTNRIRDAKLSAYEHLLKTASGGGSWRRICAQEIGELKNMLHSNR